MRSPAMPNSGAISVPMYCSDANTVSRRTEPVATRMYQPRMRFSISVPQEVSRSAGYWKRKLRTWNGANSDDRHIALTPGRCGAGSWFCAWPVRPLVTFLDGLIGQLAGRLVWRSRGGKSAAVAAPVPAVAHVNGGLGMLTARIADEGADHA